MLNYVVYRLGQFVALFLPLKIGYRLAEFLSDLHYLLSAKDRRAVTENLAAIFPEKPLEEIYGIRRLVFRNFGKYLVDFFRFSRLEKGCIGKAVRIENVSYLEDALRKNKGAILLTAHLGNWELGGVIISLSGHHIWAVALPHKHKWVDDFFNRQRESKGLRVIALGSSVTQCLSALRNNQLVALVGDRDFTGKGVVVNFFGRQTLFPLGPAVFSIRTGAPIVPGFLLRNEDDSFTLRFEKPIEPMGREDPGAIIAKYKGIFERYIRGYPEQWYMFRRFWAD